MLFQSYLIEDYKILEAKKCLFYTYIHIKGFRSGDIISIFPRYSLCDISIIFLMQKPLKLVCYLMFISHDINYFLGHWDR